MRRRHFLTQFLSTSATLGLSTASAAAPIEARSDRANAAVWSVSLFDDNWGPSAATVLSQAQWAVDMMSDGKLRLALNESNTPSRDIADALTRGDIQACCFGARPPLDLFPELTFGSKVPFGLGSQSQRTWLIDNGGLQSINVALRRRGLVAVPLSTVDAMFGLWSNRELRSAADLAGLRIAGFDGPPSLLERLALQPVNVKPAQVVQALADSAIDLYQSSGPIDDERLKLMDVVRYCYQPWIASGSTTLWLLINRRSHAALGPALAAILDAALCQAAERYGAQFDAQSAHAMRRLHRGKAVIAPMQRALLDMCYSAAHEWLSLTSATADGIGAIGRHWMAHRDQFSAAPLTDGDYRQQYLAGDWLRPGLAKFERLVPADGALRG